MKDDPYLDHEERVGRYLLARSRVIFGGVRNVPGQAAAKVFDKPRFGFFRKGIFLRKRRGA